MSARSSSTPIPFEAVEDAALYGSKCSSLGAMRRHGLPVPPGFALDPVLADRIRNRDGAAIASVSGLIDRLGGVVAVRSSGLGEDGIATSFAGQHVTVLGVRSAEELVEAVSSVVASADSDGARGYRESMKIGQTDNIAVAIQKLAMPQIAGVLFTRNPVGGADERVAEAVFGLGETLVSGMVSPANYRFARGGHIIAQEPGFQDVRLDFVPGQGIRETQVPDECQEALMLGADHIHALDQLADACERIFGAPQDIEWCIEGEQVYLLQSRPITTLQ